MILSRDWKFVSNSSVIFLDFLEIKEIRGIKHYKYIEYVQRNVYNKICSKNVSKFIRSIMEFVWDFLERKQKKIKT